MAGENADFFLQFKTDAPEFSTQLASGLDSGIQKINELTAALVAYDAQAARTRNGGSALGNGFQGLDAAAARITAATTRFTAQFGDMVGKITGLTETLVTAMNSLHGGQVPTATPSPGRDRPQGNNVENLMQGRQGRYGGNTQGFTPEQTARLEQQRRGGTGQANTTQVSQNDAAAAKVEREHTQAAEASTTALERFNGALADGTARLSTNLTELGETLAGLRENAKRLEPSTPEENTRPLHNAESITIGNSSSNPVPVNIVDRGTHRPVENRPDEPRPAAGGGGNRPPTGPRLPLSGSNSEPEEPSPSRPRPQRTAKPIATPRSQGGDLSDAARNVFSQLSAAAQAELDAAREMFRDARNDQERQAAINRGGAAFKGDPTFRDPMFRGANGNYNMGMQAGVLGQMLSADSSNPTQKYMRGVLRNGGGADMHLAATGRAAVAGGDDTAVVNDKRLDAEIEKLREVTVLAKQAEIATAAVANAFGALKKGLAEGAEGDNKLKLELAYIRALQDEAKAQRAAAQEANPSTYQKFTGRSGSNFGQDLRRHASYAVENTISYGIVFTGLEHLKEVINTGIEADAAFVRLQASLDANGVSAGNLRTQLAQISAQTATPLEHVTEAAAELSGTLKDIGELEFGTRVAAQLANISQGTLTTTEAAVGLRDMISAYGEYWHDNGISVTQGIQQTGDLIAGLSQKTGVSIKDITEGTTQIAQEASEFHLAPRQAASLAAYVSRATGQGGEEAAAQTSRMLATLYNGKVQTTLERTNDRSGNPIATAQQFASGDVGSVLENLIKNYGDLPASARQQIASQMGTGIQARAFAAVAHGGSDLVDQMEGIGTGNDAGSLGRQNQQYLQTVSGSIKQLDEDFQNLGNTLQRLGAIDTIAVLARAADELLKAFNATFGRIASIMDNDPITRTLSHWAVMLVEARAAWSLLGGTITKALAKSGFLPNATANEAGQYDPVSMGTAGNAVTGRAVRGGRNLAGRAVSAVSLQAEEGLTLRQTLNRNVAAGLGLGQLRRGGGLFSGVRDRVGSATEGMRGVLGGQGATEADDRLVAASNSAAAGLEKVAAASTEAAAAERTEATAARTAATAEGTLAADSEIAGGATLGSRFSQFGAGLGSSIAGLAGGVGLTALIAGGATVLSNATGRAAARDDAATALLNGSASADDFAATSRAGSKSVNRYEDWLTGGSTSMLGAAGHTLMNFGTSYQALTQGRLFDSGQIGSGPSQESSDRVTSLMSNRYAGARKNLPKLDTVDKVNEWLDTINKGIDSQASDIEKAGGNDKAAQAQIAFNINQLKATLASEAQNRRDAINGLHGLDKMNLDQTNQLLSTAGVIGQYNANTLRTQAPAIQAMIANTGLVVGSRGYNALQQASQGQANLTGEYHGQVGHFDDQGTFHGTAPARATEGGFAHSNGRTRFSSDAPTVNANERQLSPPTSKGRLTGLRTGYQTAITEATSQLQNGTLSSDQRTQWQQALQTALSGYQSVNDQIYQNPIQVAQTRASMATATGGTTAGGDARAISYLKQANAALTVYNRTLDHTLPEYYTNMAQIQQNQQQIAQLQASPEILALTTQAAGTSDASGRASLQYQIALATLRRDQKAGATSDVIGGDQAAIAGANLGIAQAGEQVSASGAQVGIARIRNTASRAQAQLNEALRQENVYRSGGLADQQSYNNAVQQEIQDRQQLSDALQATTQSELDVTAALANLHGDALAAARTALTKANGAYRYAVQQYGANSTEANTAMAAAIQAQQTYNSAALDQLNSGLDLQIAQLNARGQSGDAERAATDAVTKARNAIAAYRSAGGRTGTTQYNQLAAQLATAQRTAFDTALQAQLDTLDFQQQTYQITSAQEVASLQQILRNKQLTLKEQRDITLKIKNMQESIRDQLTQGGMNIPSDIKLPTAYEVRRSLGAGFGGSGASASTVVNNNQRVSVAITQNVPTAAVAAAIANQVITTINRQTGQQVRANTSTPRLVTTR